MVAAPFFAMKKHPMVPCNRAINGSHPVVAVFVSKHRLLAASCVALGRCFCCFVLKEEEDWAENKLE